MAQWQIDSKEYLSRLDLDMDGFKRELKLPKADEVNKVIPLRDITAVQSIL